MSVDDGGPAFPFYQIGDARPEKRGLTLRDYYAGQAMQAMLSNIGYRGEKITETAYEIADLMIARKRETEKADE